MVVDEKAQEDKCEAISLFRYAFFIMDGRNR